MESRSATTLVLQLALASLVAVAGCGDPDRLLAVDLQTDYVPGVEFRQVRTAVRVEGTDFDRVVTHDADRDDDYGAGVRVAELEDLPRGDVRIDVELLGASRAVVDDRRARARIRGRHLVTVVITRNCTDVACPGPGDDPSLTECIDARCEDPRCTPETGEHCTPGGCESSSDCNTAGLPSCVSPKCESGACLTPPDPDACAEDEWCNPDTGCEPLPSPSDGGVDAGPCPEEPCRVVAPQCGCGSSEKCALDASTETVSCQPDGTAALGESCEMNEDCMGSGLCSQTLGGGPSGPMLCHALCRTDADCPGSDRYCVDTFSLDSLGICSHSCVPLTNTGCDGELDCMLILLARQQDDSTVAAAMCTEAGTTSVGESCGDSGECVAQAACSSECRPLCDLGAPDCPAGTTCQEASGYENAVFGATDIRHGLCL